MVCLNGTKPSFFTTSWCGCETSISTPKSGVRPTDLPSISTSASDGIDVMRSLCAMRRRPAAAWWPERRPAWAGRATTGAGFGAGGGSMCTGFGTASGSTCATGAGGGGASVGAGASTRGAGASATGGLSAGARRRRARSRLALAVSDHGLALGRAAVGDARRADDLLLPLVDGARAPRARARGRCSPRARSRSARCRSPTAAPPTDGAGSAACAGAVLVAVACATVAPASGLRARCA